VVGLAVPGMPVDAPGMGGTATRRDVVVHLAVGIFINHELHSELCRAEGVSVAFMVV
jgi:hypothetical protein